MKYWLAHIWKKFSGQLQWRILWLVNDKFNIGITGIVATSNGKVLLLRHIFRRRDQWSLPSGWVKKNETIFEAIVREVKEETNLNISSKKVIKIESGFKLRIGFYILCDLTKEKDLDLIIDEKELLEGRFFSINQLPENMEEMHKLIIIENLT